MIPGSVKIFVCTRPVDMRRSFDGLALAAREVMGEDPRSGALFCFVNKRRDRLKALWWDRNGYCILYKRVHAAMFEVPKATDADAASVRVNGATLAEILAGVERRRRRRPGRR
jgi:transposase